MDLSRYYWAMRDPQVFACRFCHTARLSEHGIRAELIPGWGYLNPFWEAVRNRDRIVVEKTRQMMLSWTSAAAFLHDILFHRDTEDLFISRKEKLVDDGGSRSKWRSLLGKVRYIHQRLPEELQAPLEFSHLTVHNPETGATIVGESSESQAGRSGTYWRAFMDEAAFIPHGELVYGGLDDACPDGLGLGGTPNGKANVQFRLRNDPQSGFKVLRFHWRDHPERKCDCSSSDDPAEHSGCWYAKKCEGKTSLQIARELNISYESSVAGKVWYGWSDDFVAHVPFLPGLRVTRWWDFGVGDQTAILCTQEESLHTANNNVLSQVRIFDGYRNSGKGAVHYRDVLQKKAQEWGGVEVRDIGDPHNLASRDSNLTSWQINLENDQHPYKIFCDPSGCRGLPYETVLDNARKFQQFVLCKDGKRRPRLLVDRDLRALINCFEGWKYRTDEEGQITSEKPIHDEMSHWMDAYKYGAWDTDPMLGTSGPFEKSDFITVGGSDLFKEGDWY